MTISDVVLSSDQQPTVDLAAARLGTLHLGTITGRTSAWTFGALP